MELRRLLMAELTELSERLQDQKAHSDALKEDRSKTEKRIELLRQLIELEPEKKK